MPKEGPHCICLSVMIDFVFKIDKNYYKCFWKSVYTLSKKELREYIYENYYKQIGFTGKETIIYLKRLEKHK